MQTVYIGNSHSSYIHSWQHTHTHWHVHTHTHTKVEVEHSYSLSNIEKVDYNEVINLILESFRLIFPTFTIILQAETAEEAKDWVEKIRTGECGTYGVDLQTSLQKL